MKIAVVSATTFEQLPFITYLDQHFMKKSFFQYQKGNIDIFPFVTGVGLTFTAYGLAKFFNTNKVDLAIQIGVGGAYNKAFNLGEVYNVSSEQFGDLGAEEKNGNLIDAFELGLIQNNQAPFSHGKLLNPDVDDFNFLPSAKGLTVHKVNGSLESIQKITNKYQADIESMEGAGFFYSCLMEDIKFLQLRAISNYVEERNKDNWNLELAIEQVNKALIELVDTLS